MPSGVYRVDQVRAAEEKLMRTVPAAELMQRAARGLLNVCVDIITTRGRVAGANVVALIGSGNNGGDALWAVAGLATRGATVVAVGVGPTMHREGAAALLAAGGNIIDAHDGAAEVDLAGTDLVVDGITGIGGRGALRGPALIWVRAAAASGAMIVAVDVPSGVDADTGAIEDLQACVEADVTVTFGVQKPGLLVAPGNGVAGHIVVVDIGLDAVLPPPQIQVLDEVDFGSWLTGPAHGDYKYSRGVVGVAAGSPRYRGAAFLATAGARYGTSGMTRFLDRGDGIAAAVVEQFWDVVSAESTGDPRVSSWVIGPGLGTDEAAAALLAGVLGEHVPVVLDADALRILDPCRARVHERFSAGHLTILTPHEGEFVGLGYQDAQLAEDRIGLVQRAAADLSAIVVLKGPGTIIAEPGGGVIIDTVGGPELGTAGSGDVLTGLMGSLLARTSAPYLQTGRNLPMSMVMEVVGTAVGVHGLAGRLAAKGQVPITAQDIARQLPDAIAELRK
ncbi:MAG: NAD(P)H-hydrate epimerase [Candidatus Nanopelagicales bacterium]